MVPEGRIRFWALIVFTTSLGESPLDLERLEIQIHLHLALLATVGIGTLSALDGCELRADEIQPEVIQLLFGEALAREAKLENGHAGGGVGNDQRRGSARRQLAQLCLGRCCDLGNRCGHCNFGLEINLHYGNPVEGLRFNMVDIVDDGGEVALAEGDDAVGHIHRGKALVLPNDANDRNIDVGENIGRGIQNGKRAEDQQQEREDGEGVGSPQRKTNNPHLLAHSSRHSLATKPGRGVNICADEPARPRWKNRRRLCELPSGPGSLLNPLKEWGFWQIVATQIIRLRPQSGSRRQIEAPSLGSGGLVITFLTFVAALLIHN